ncbi:MAG: (deoxy)nucleoside triphosphate pyrophosphohydrolase [Leptospirillum sp.]|nr:(deoxy)nucleoside triphosphate pyrophosphohydrolase [Nitrospiraceae bacterium]MDA8149534.1 (deoxy)nucleoside triphosphate pyrophosphohydrolase [Nitrospiraceae bacterium]
METTDSSCQEPSGGEYPLEVSCGIIIKNGKILCAKRLPGSWDDLWEFPGGKVETGESPVEAVVRELQEELNIQVEVLLPMPPVFYRYPHLYLRLSPFICRILKNTPQMTVHEEIRWLEPAELKGLEWLAPNWKILDDLEAILQNNPHLLKK